MILWKFALEVATGVATWRWSGSWESSIVNFPFILAPSNSENPILLELSFGYFVLENYVKNITESLENGAKKDTS